MSMKGILGVGSAIFMATTNEVDRAVQLAKDALDLVATGRVKVATVSRM